MAPEIVSKQEYAGPPADIWALGVLLYTMLCGSFPFRGSNDTELYEKIKNGLTSFPSYLTPLSMKLIQKLLTLNPEDRPTAIEILNEEWFKAETVIKGNKSPKRLNKGINDAYSEYFLSGSQKRIKIPQINIYNNYTQIFHEAEPKCELKLDSKLVDTIKNLGFSLKEINQQIKNQNSHIALLYKKLNTERTQSVHNMKKSSSQSKSAQKISYKVVRTHLNYPKIHTLDNNNLHFNQNSDSSNSVVKQR